MSRNVNLAYRGHQIIAAMIKGAPLAQVYVGKTLATRERFAGDTLDDAVNRARSWVDTQRSEAIQNRRSAGVGTVEEYVAFFSAQPLAEHHRVMLVAHASAPDRTLTAGELAAAAGWADFGAANLHYGKLGDQVAQTLELELPKHLSGKPIATSALADSVDPDWKPIEGFFRWRLHEEVAEALERLNIR
ncbi:hypothetical protein ACYQR9_03680 [Methylobacterium sp. CM6241]